MSWIISRALMNSLYSQEQEEEFLQESYSDGTQSVQLSGNPTPQAFLSQDRMKKFSRLSRFGMTYKPLMESRGKELLTLYLEGFLVKTLVQQDKEKALQESEVVYGNTWQESSEKWSQLSLLLKTPLCSALEDSVLSSKTLPKWGTMRNGECFQQKPLVQIMKGKECGLLLPTPTCHNSKEGAYPAEFLRKTITLGAVLGGKPNPVYIEWMMGWPLGWTDLKPQVTDKFPSVQQQLGTY